MRERGEGQRRQSKSNSTKREKRAIEAEQEQQQQQQQASDRGRARATARAGRQKRQRGKEDMRRKKKEDRKEREAKSVRDLEHLDASCAAQDTAHIGSHAARPCLPCSPKKTNGRPNRAMRARAQPGHKGPSRRRSMTGAVRATERSVAQHRSQRARRRPSSDSSTRGHMGSTQANANAEVASACPRSSPAPRRAARSPYSPRCSLR
eukprot:Amastigsp_a185763_6.p1 type:complete len:207 gc:universal Amastigsp_a185763_6:29-649(+)